MTGWQDLEFLSNSKVCKRCTGRMFAKVGHGLTNEERGEHILFTLRSLSMDFASVPEEECSICGGLFLKLSAIADSLASDLERYQFNTFLVGSQSGSAMNEMELRYVERFKEAESIKKEFNREFGKLLFARLGHEVDLKNPDIIVTVSLDFLNYKLWVKPLYIHGRYRKLVRGIPQTRWVKYDRTGSVEETVGEPASKLAGATNFYLHAAGREDVDVRMLGDGREFVVELEAPKTRKIDLAALKQQINASTQVEVSDLDFVSKEMVEKVKNSRHDKTYVATIKTEGPVDAELMKSAVDAISGKVIYQRTPLRVSRRRADLIRERTIRKAKLLGIDGQEARIELKTENGTYIKELISGDNGRTNPSLSGLYGSSIVVEGLDVMQIDREEQ